MPSFERSGGTPTTAKGVGDGANIHSGAYRAALWGDFRPNFVRSDHNGQLRQWNDADLDARQKMQEGAGPCKDLLEWVAPEADWQPRLW